jgi:nitric oxide reductase large subunit
LVLFCLRGLRGQMAWNTKPLAVAFWSFNIGLAMIVLLPLLMHGQMQLLATLEHGCPYARSAEPCRSRSWNCWYGCGCHGTPCSASESWYWPG